MVARRLRSAYLGALLAVACRHPPLTPENVGGRVPPVLFIGLDGADWQLLDPYIAAGAMPNLAALVREGQSGVLTTIHPPLSPLVWTTMMTGVSPLTHRILDFTQFDPATGEREPITAAERQAPAIWNMASRGGRTVAVFGLWATYPAEAVKGLLVTDRFSSFTAFSARERLPAHGLVYPETQSLWALDALAATRGATGFRELQRYLPWLSASAYQELAQRPDPYAHPVSALREILIETRVYGRLAQEWISRERPDLAIVYFQGTDSIGHVFAPYAPPRMAAVSAADFDHYREVPQRYFTEIDGLLGTFRELAAARHARLVLASDHGFEWAAGRPDHLESARVATAGRWHREEGIYLLWGPGIAAGDRGSRPRAGVAQLCSTLLTLLGLPPGEGLAGPALPGTPAPSPAQTPVDYRRGYQAPLAVAASAPDPGLAQLRALNYVGSAEPTRGTGGQARTRTAPSFNNEGLLLREAGRPAAAEAAFAAALERDPHLGSAAWNLSDLVLQEAGDIAVAGRDAGMAAQLDRSDRLLASALAADLPEGVERTAERLAIYRRAGVPQRLGPLLEAAVAARPAEPRLRVERGRLRLEEHRCREAAEDFAKAIAMAESDPLAHASHGLALLCLGDGSGGRAAIRRSLELDPAQPELRRFLEAQPPG